METINLASFLAYFGSYYPILLPSIALLLGVIAVMLDQLRVWVITYVDEGESGPYKRYVIPFLRKLLNLRDEEEAKSIGWHQEVLNLGIRGGGNVNGGTEVYAFLTMHVSPTKAKELQRIIDKYGLSEEKDLYHHVKYGVDLSGDYTLKPEPDIHIVGESLLWAALITAGLTAYKFLPEITIGCLVGYAVMRLARSIVRLTKRFNKHISDGHGVNDKATQGAESTD